MHQSNVVHIGCELRYVQNGLTQNLVLHFRVFEMSASFTEHWVQYCQ